MPDKNKPVNVEALKALVRTVPDFPKPGDSVLRHHQFCWKDKTGFCAVDRRVGGTLH